MRLGGSLRRFSAVLVLALAANLLPGVPSYVGGPTAASADDEMVPPDPAPPPVSQENRLPAPAGIDIEGNIDPPVVTPDLGVDPFAAIAGLTEDPGARTQLSDTYQVNGADHLLQISSAPLNYQDATGAWVPVDTQLVAEDGGYRNGGNSFTAHFPNTLSSLTPIKVDIGGGSFTFVPVGATSSPIQVNDGTADYSNMPATIQQLCPSRADICTGFGNPLPGDDFYYVQANAGFKELIVLRSALSTLPIAFHMTTTNLSLRQEASGDVSVLDGDGNVVAVLPAPGVVNPLTGQVDYSVTINGNTVPPVVWQLLAQTPNDYSLSLHLDPQYMATASYPITVDPGSFTMTPDRDTWVESASAYRDTSHETSSELRVGNDSSSLHYGWVNFYVGDKAKPGRIVQAANIDLLAISAASSTTDVYIRPGTGKWPTLPDNPMTYDNQPPVASSNTDNRHGASNTWYAFNVKDPYQRILDSNIGATNYGFRLHGDSNATGTNYHRFASAETTITDTAGHKVPPQLLLYYDDLPDKPVLLYPDANAAIETQSPTLRVSGIPTDPNGDDVLVQFEVSTDPTDFTGSNLKWFSPWQASTSYAVPAGVLQDGQTYYWRARSWDVCGPGADALCYLNDYSPPATNSRQFKVTVRHFGTDDRWPMWSDPLGNGMSLQVNEANGNLFLDYPIDSLPTPAGALDLHLYYNHQDAVDRGIGLGWFAGAGPGAARGELPVQLTSLDNGDTVKVRQSNGNTLYFSKGNGNVYGGVGAGAGVVRKNKDNTWTYTTATDSQYAFGTSGDLTAATPSTSTSGSEGFRYSFDASTHHLLQVTDPLNRHVSFSYTGPGGRLSSITTWGSATPWSLGYDGTGTKLASVSDPEGGIVRFGYDPTLGDLNSVKDGDNYETTIAYATPTVSGQTMLPRVASVKAPGNADATTFSYLPPYTGQIDTETRITDPRGNASSSTSDRDFQTNVDMDAGGLPIQIAGPANDRGKWPVTTMRWDTNGNLTCKRGPAANAVALHCNSSDEAGTHYNLSTEYTYETRAPYKLLTVTGPAPNTAGTGVRPVSAYRYDEGLSALFEEKYENMMLSGVPDVEALDPTIDHAWDPAPAGINDSTYFSVRWSGYLRTTGAVAKYHFRLYADDGARLIVGSNLLTDCIGEDHVYGYNCGSGTDAVMQLWPGDHPITVEYSHDLTENGQNPSHVDLKWAQGGDTLVDIPSAAYTPNLGLLTSETDPLGATTTYGYSDGTRDFRTRHLPRTVTISGTGSDPARTTTYDYDAFGRITSKATADGTTSTSFNPSDGCLAQVTDPTNAVTTYQCDPAGDIQSLTQAIRAKDTQLAQSRTTSSSYDKVGRLRSVTTTDGTYTVVRGNTYDHSGRLTRTDLTATNAQGQTVLTRTTTYGYDPATGRMVLETLPDPDGAGPLSSPTVGHAWDEAGNETTTTDPRNQAWIKVYDASNRVISSKDPYLNRTTTSYDDDGQAGTPGRPTVTVTDPSGVATVSAFDVQGRKTSVQVGALAPSTYAYDVGGNLRVSKATDPTGAWVRTTVNAFGERSVLTIPAGTGGADANTAYSYNPAGHLASLTDANTKTTAYSYDGAGRLRSVTAPDVAGSWVIDYDDASERVRLTDPDGRIRDWSYDPMGRLGTYTEHPDAQTARSTTYHYDGASEVSSIDDPRGYTLTFVYDQIGRKTQQYRSGTPSDVENFGYDPAGNLTSASTSNSAVSVAIGYDNAGRLQSVDQGSAHTTYTYTANRLDHRSDPAGTTSFHYDSAGRVDKITDPLTAQQLTAYTFDDAGRELTRTDPAGLTTTRSYAPGTGWLASETITKPPSTTPIASFGYGYDPAGNVSSATQSLPGNSDASSWAYAYDGSNRLKSATPDADQTRALHYTYDGAGNRRTVQVGTGTTVTTTYDGASLPTGATDGTTYAFDGADELTGVSGGPRTLSFCYDSWGRTASSGGTCQAPTVSYGYDALDRLMSRTKAGATITYAYVGTTEDPASMTVSGTTTKYAWDPGGPLAQSASGVIKVFEQNLHGDLAMVASTAGASTGTIAYGPYGDKRVSTGDGTSATFGFQSDLTDSDTGFVDMGARNYDPVQGRFATRDSVFGDPQTPVSLNQFIYGGADPVSLTDPDGMCSNPDWCPPTNPDGSQHSGSFVHQVSTTGARFYGWSHSTYRYVPHATQPAPPPVPPKVLPTVLKVRLVDFVVADESFGGKDGPLGGDVPGEESSGTSGGSGGHFDSEGQWIPDGEIDPDAFNAKGYAETAGADALDQRIQSAMRGERPTYEAHTEQPEELSRLEGRSPTRQPGLPARWGSPNRPPWGKIGFGILAGVAVTWAIYRECFAGPAPNSPEPNSWCR